MRAWRWLAPSLVLLLCLTGPALAAPRSGSLLDPAGDVVSADGYARPDVAQFTVAHDPDTGALVTTVRFHGAVPRQQAGRATAFTVTYNVGRAAAQGYCDWTHTGDLGVRIDVVRAPEGDYIVQTATPRPTGPDVRDNASGAFSADSTTLTVATAHAQFAGRDYTCVSPMRVTYDPLPGADEVGEFFFAGFEPPPAAPDDQLPTVRWERPSSGSTISGVYSEGGQNGSHSCLLSASDNVRVNRIEIFVDGVPTEVQRFAPWGCELDTRNLAEGAHLLRADAYDEAGNRASTAISVTVRNSGVTPPPPAPPVVIPPGVIPIPPVVTVTLPDPKVEGGGAPPPPVVIPKVIPNVISRLEPFMRCRVRSGKVRSCRLKTAAFLSVRVTDATGALRADTSGRVRLTISCSPSRVCGGRRTIRLRTRAPKLTSLIGRRPLGVGTVIDLRITRPGTIGSFHRLKLTRSGPRTKTCEIRGGRPTACG